MKEASRDGKINADRGIKWLDFSQSFLYNYVWYETKPVEIKWIFVCPSFVQDTVKRKQFDLDYRV